MSSPITVPVKNIHINDIQPRLQWEHNGGYCGEVSMISAGLYYGQYLSQYRMRSIASCGAPQNAYNETEKTYTSQLLLGTKNAVGAAESVRLDYEEFNAENTENFLVWVKHHVLLGHPVIIGVFNNENMLYNMKYGNGDDEYDHIVPVFGFGSNHPFTDNNFYPDDIILFSDNGLYTQPGDPLGYTAPLQGYDAPYRYYFTLETGKDSPVYDFILDRTQANAADGNIYSLLNLPAYQNTASSKKNYALAITGVKDPNRETFPVRIVTHPNFELPNINSDSDVKPEAMPMTLEVTVSGLTPGKSYTLYRYDASCNVPVADFHENAYFAVSAETIVINSGSSWTATYNIQSDQEVFFRAVLGKAA